MRFNYYCPTKIHFGDEGLRALPQYLSDYKNIALVVHKGFNEKYGYPDRVIEFLKGKKVKLVDDITPNPKIEEICSYSKDEYANIDAVIGLGGGSAIDAAKAFSVHISRPEDLEEMFLNDRNIDFIIKPVYAIPTTAGTGAEMSKGCILTSKKMKIKKGLRGNSLFPEAAILVPELTLSVSVQKTMETGFDALTHAIETFVSKKSSPITRLYSRKAIRIVFETLPLLSRNPDNLENRSKMLYSSMLMGINLANASTCMPHRLQYPVGALTDTGHGRGLAALYPAWVKSTYTKSQDKFAEINDIYNSIYPDEAGENEEGWEFIDKFLKRINLVVSLGDIGLSSDNIEELVNGVTGSLDADPGYSGVGLLESIYSQSF